MKSRAFGFVAGRCLEAVSGFRVGSEARHPITGRKSRTSVSSFGVLSDKDLLVKDRATPAPAFGGFGDFV